jgi:molybdopterin molybdotransferase
MISFNEAIRLVSEAALPIGSEKVAIADAAGRRLASPVVAMIDSPPTDVSAMDGYAVRDSDLPGSVRVIGESFAGNGFAGGIEPGTGVRIFTGAAVPAGADRVVIQEVVIRDGETARIDEVPGASRHIRRQGSDFRAADRLLQAGRRLDARAMVAAAGADIAQVEVWRRPKVIILGTGDELAPPGEARQRPGAIPESVSFGVAALIDQYGGRNVETRRIADDLPAMQREAVEAARQADLVVVTGGASVGEKDFAKAMFEPMGLELLFAKLAIKPGKPVWFGRAAGKWVMGLPGNPTSAMVTARLLLAPLVAGLAGEPGASQWRSVPLGGALPATGDRETFHRARFDDGRAWPLANVDSSAQKTLAEADLLLRSRVSDPARDIGEAVEAIDF